MIDEPRTLAFRVVNSGSTATGVELSLTFPASLDVQPQGLACTLDQGSALCDLGDLVDGAQVPVTFSVTSPTNGNYSIIVALATDLTPDADRATVRLNVTSAAAVDAGGGGGGGGGAVGLLSLLLLAGLGAPGRRRPTRR